jgi:hypothetical protein
MRSRSCRDRFNRALYVRPISQKWKAVCPRLVNQNFCHSDRGMGGGQKMRVLTNSNEGVLAIPTLKGNVSDAPLTEKNSL